MDYCPCSFVVGKKADYYVELMDLLLVKLTMWFLLTVRLQRHWHQ